MSKILKDLRIELERFMALVKYRPAEIRKYDRTTVVYWLDGTVTAVRCAPDDLPDDYVAFCIALAKKIYGNNSRLKHEIKGGTERAKMFERNALPETAETQKDGDA